MAYIRDSVIDQYGNAVANARIDLFNVATGALMATVYSDLNGFFEFSVITGTYRIQVSGANLTTRLIGPIIAVDPYGTATYTANGLMAAADKVKLDNYPTNGVTISGANDFVITGSLADTDVIQWATGISKWTNTKPASTPYALKISFTPNGGTVDKAGLYPQLDGNGHLDYSFLNVTPVGGQSTYQGRLPVLDITGRLDASLFQASAVGGPAYVNWLAKLNPGGLIDNSMLNLASVGGASAANKIPKLNSSGRVDPSMLPTTGGTYRGSLDLTVAYVAPSGWVDGDYGSCSKAGTVHSTWNAYLNDPIPTTVKVGDNVYYTGGKYSVVPSATDLAAYLPRDGSSPMTGHLTLIAQSGASPATGDQAVSRIGGDALWLRRQTGALNSVTQITSKSTAVSLNAIEGKIVTHNEELLAACMAGPRFKMFQLSNTWITPTATIVINHHSSGTPGAYKVWAGQPVAGACTIYIENVSGAPLAQAITLQFQILVGP